MTGAFVECPHCDSTAAAVQPLGGGHYECTCCSKTFTWKPERRIDDDRPSGRHNRRGKNRQDWE